MNRLNEHEAFLGSIFDTPTDPTPRLVYADFLDENGEPDRAALIRLQCELAAENEHAQSETRLSLRARQQELLARLAAEMESTDSEPNDACGYDRGFLPGCTAVLTPSELDNPTALREKIVRILPNWFGARSIAVAAGSFLHPEHIEAMFAIPALQRIAIWNLAGHVEEVAGDPLTEDAGTYALIDMKVQPVITRDGVDVLARQRGARRITELILTNNNLDNDAARALIRSPYLVQIKRLDYGEGNRYSGKTWADLCERFGRDVVG